MAGIAYLVFFLAGGLTISRAWLPRLRPLTRWYAGVSVGLLLMLWLPVLWAYVVSFTVTAHLLAALTLLLLMLFAYLTRDRSPRVRYGTEDQRMLRAVLIVAIPLTMLAGWLEYSHSIRLTADGTYHVGQSTYGDLSLHLAVTTSIVDAKFPLQNSLMVGATMAYPYLTDSFATTMYMLGMNLPEAMAFTGSVLCSLVFVGYTLLCAQLCRRRGAVWLAACLLFLNGGFGFFYTLSGTVSNGTVTNVWDNLKTVMTGYYMTPTNQPDTNNLRWVNILCDMLVPQRGILGGWAMLLPALNLIVPPLSQRRRYAPRALILAGAIAGGMPLLHTHSFLALALCSLGFCLYATFSAPRGKRMEALKPFILYGCVAAALSQAQLINFTFVQATQSDHFLRFQFNWCNNRGGRGLVDPYFWFYIKNIGLPYLLILLALLARRKGDLRDEADKAAAMLDGLYILERKESLQLVTNPADDAEFAGMEDADDGEPSGENTADDPAEKPDIDAQERRGAPPEGFQPARASAIAHDMPSYGQSGMLGNMDEDLAKPTMDLPFVRPLPPEKLRASAFSPDDSDRVGVMRAVTGSAHAEQSRRPLLEEIFHSTYREAEDENDPSGAQRFTDGMPETCFADEPPARDWVRQNRLIAAGAFLILLVAELFLFQPNEYDNNKLIYVWFLLCLPMAADYALELFSRLGGLGGRRVIATLFLITCFLSAGLTVAREVISDYQAYSADDIAVADFVKANTPEHSVFITGNQHLNAVASLAGRTILCGSDLYLYYHGFTTTGRKAEVKAFYEDPRANLSLLTRYQVQYVYLSPAEWMNYDVDADTLRTLFPVVYESEGGSYVIFSVPENYRKTTVSGAQAATVTPTPDPALNPASGG